MEEEKKLLEGKNAPENIGKTVVISKEELEKLFKQSSEYLATLKQVQADFINYQERVKRERESLVKFAIADFIKDLLPVFDHLEKAIEIVAKASSPTAEGLRLAQKEIMAVFTKYGVVPIRIDKLFNPELHEVVQVVNSEKLDSNTIIEVVRNGYMIYNKVLRPAQVKLAKKVENVKKVENEYKNK